MNLTAGTYKVAAKLGEWYAGEQYDASNARVGYGKEYKPVLYAAVYDVNGKFVKSKLSATIDETNTITIEELTVSDGETVKLMIWDGTNLKPLISKRAIR